MHINLLSLLKRGFLFKIFLFLILIIISVFVLNLKCTFDYTFVMTRVRTGKNS